MVGRDFFLNNFRYQIMIQTNHCIKIYYTPTLMYERFRLFNSPYQVHMKTTKPNNVGGNFIQTKKH